MALIIAQVENFPYCSLDHIANDKQHELSEKLNKNKKENLKKNTK